MVVVVVVVVVVGNSSTAASSHRFETEELGAASSLRGNLVYYADIYAHATNSRLVVRVLKSDMERILGCRRFQLHRNWMTDVQKRTLLVVAFSSPPPSR